MWFNVNLRLLKTNKSVFMSARCQVKKKVFILWFKICYLKFVLTLFNCSSYCRWGEELMPMYPLQKTWPYKYNVHTTYTSRSSKESGSNWVMNRAY